MGCLLSLYHSAVLSELGCAVCSCISTAIHESPRASVMPGLDFRGRALTPSWDRQHSGAPGGLLDGFRHSVGALLQPPSQFFPFCCFPPPALLWLQLGSRGHVCVSRLHMETGISVPLPQSRGAWPWLAHSADVQSPDLISGRQK